MNEAGTTSARLQRIAAIAPVYRFFGMQVAHCENGVARIALPYREEFCDQAGALASEIVVAAAEMAGRFAVLSIADDAQIGTVEMNVNFVGGDHAELLGIGEVLRRGRGLAVCHLEVVQGSDRPIAIGLGTYTLSRH